MRLLTACLLATLTAAASGGRAQAQQNEPPHAWLFGSWTGGLFPASSNLTAQSCLATPVVVFTRDVVLRATLTEVAYTQRVIETARTNPGVTEFRFVPATPGATAAGLLGLAGPAPQAGFGCDDPNALHVQRRSDNEISFPGCADFPNPLVRCPSR